jgi:hypothetical protein
VSKITSVNPYDKVKEGDPPIMGIIGHLRSIDDRLQAIENKLWPKLEDGSGTERYDNWTQHSDGTDYPGSYGVGEQKPFVPFSEPDIVAGDSIRVVQASGEVDPVVHVVTEATASVVTFEVDGVPVDVPRDHVVKVVPPQA